MAERKGQLSWLWLWASGAIYIGALLTSGCNAADAEGSGKRGANNGGTGGRAGAAGMSGQGGSGGGLNGIDNPMGIPVEYDSGVVGTDAEVQDPDNQNCGATSVTPMVMKETIPGNVLLVFDRSGSMDEPFPTTGRKKWEEARDAVYSALEPLVENVTVGAIFFPHADGCGGGGGSCCVPAFGTAPQINFMPGAEFLTAWTDFWTTAPGVVGSTPTLEALQVAAQALNDNASTLTGTTTVVLITDGEPRCAAGEPEGGFFGAGTTPELIAQWISLLSTLPAQWVLNGINTHVLGIPGADSAAGIQVLDGVAVAGGTSQHISAADPAALQAELAKIIGESVSTTFNSCSIGLPMEPPDREKVVLAVTEGGVKQSVARDLGTGGGWTLTGEGDELQIILQGELCNQARLGTYSEISVVFGCIDLPPLPPPKPD